MRMLVWTWTTTGFEPASSCSSLSIGGLDPMVSTVAAPAARQNAGSEGCQGDTSGRIRILPTSPADGGPRVTCATMAVSATCGKSSGMSTANDQLRRARERTESPTHTGESLSRQELAELVNAYVWR